DAVNVGDRVTVKAFVSLGELAPSDVEVQVNHGLVADNDEIADFATVSLTLAETYEAGRYQFSRELTLEQAGAFGYSVRIVPNHPAISRRTELALVATA